MRSSLAQLAVILALLVAGGSPARAQFSFGFDPLQPVAEEPFLVVVGGMGSCPFPEVSQTRDYGLRVLVVEVEDQCLAPPVDYLLEVPIQPLKPGAWRLDLIVNGAQQSQFFVVEIVPLSLSIVPLNPREHDEVELVLRYAASCGLHFEEPVWDGRLATLHSAVGGCGTPPTGSTEQRISLGALTPGRYRVQAFETLRDQQAGVTFDVAAEGSCFPSDLSVCLLDGRFQVDAIVDANGLRQANAVPKTDQTAAFWFFEPDNVELMVKVLDACDTPHPRFWVFAAGLTDREVEIRVRDIVTGDLWTSTNPAGQAFQPVFDTEAFATCDAAAQ